jgi:tetratricopeptide (TPR) repeat protein
VGDAEIRGRALNPLGVAQMALGEIEEGAAVLREAIAVARARPALPELGSAAVNLADRLHLAGRSREGLAVARDVLDDLSPTRVSRIGVLLLIAEVSYEIGEWDEAARALPRLDRRPAGTLGLNAGLRRAELALGRGDHDAAAEVLDALDALVEGTTEPQFLAAYGALLAQLRRRTGDPDGAPRRSRRRSTASSSAPRT